MLFSPRGVEEPNHLHCKKGRIINLWIITGKKKKTVLKFRVFLKCSRPVVSSRVSAKTTGLHERIL